MAYEAVKWREMFATELDAAALDIEGLPSRDRYDLTRALRVVRQMETSVSRGAVFEEIKNKNPLYRLVDAVYSGVGFLQPLALFAYMLKCVVSLGRFGDTDAEAVAISTFPNEHKTVDRIAALVPDVKLLRLSSDRRNLVGRGQLVAALRMLGSLPRIWKFLSLLAKTHSFMPAARIASALAFYMRFSRLFADHPGLKAAVVTSNYSPDAVGMAAAAHRAGRRLIYANHAPVPANGAVVPPVLADCALFYGDAIRQTYERRSRCTAEVALIGQPYLAREMEWRDEVQQVGIFLTAGTRTDVLSNLISTIRKSSPGTRILIRNHPVALLKTDLSDLAADDANLEITIGNPLDDEIAACDVVICGNSGVALNVLSGGRPVAYLASLDGIGFDANGFVESGLVCSVPQWTDDTYERLKAFYSAPGWQDVMRSYDASYGLDPESLRREAAATLKRHLRPLPFDDMLEAASRAEGLDTQEIPSPIFKI